MFLKNSINLSILIPCYNWDIYDLASDLHHLCLEETLINKFEIICIEDGSQKCFNNNEISKLKNIKYHKLNKNIGRSKIRNLMAKKSIYTWLLFIDCDSKLINPNFIHKYMEIAARDRAIEMTESNKINKLYYGSTTYPVQTPKKNKTLHWKYGKEIESKRKKYTFSSHHFLIRKIQFQTKNKKPKIQFNETISSYGYEDSFFIIENNLNPIYIENPLCHIGIKTNTEFIKNTKSALTNLSNYSKTIKDLEKEIKLVRISKKLSSIYLHWIIILLFKVLKIHILKNLHSINPSLLLFQFYKLGCFLEENNQ